MPLTATISLNVTNFFFIKKRAGVIALEITTITHVISHMTTSEVSIKPPLLPGLSSSLLSFIF
jgi:hypothetical protein